MVSFYTNLFQYNKIISTICEDITNKQLIILYSKRAGKAPTGHHLDVTKDDKLIQKLMIDEKKCYLFGRNPQLNDFCIDHGSCSRIHAALVYHKHLNISYLVDLGSSKYDIFFYNFQFNFIYLKFLSPRLIFCFFLAHGTFIGNLRLEERKPTQLQLNSTFHFGASTRYDM